MAKAENFNIKGDYLIYQNCITKKFGIKDTSIDCSVVKCIFDDIVWWDEYVVFTLNGYKAVYKVSDIKNL